MSDPRNIEYRHIKFHRNIYGVPNDSLRISQVNSFKIHFGIPLGTLSDPVLLSQFLSHSSSCSRLRPKFHQLFPRSSV